MVRDRHDGALAELADGPRHQRARLAGRLQAGQIELRRDRARVAERFFRKALELEPDLVKAHSELIYIYGYPTPPPRAERRVPRLTELAPSTSRRRSSGASRAGWSGSPARPRPSLEQVRRRPTPTTASRGSPWPRCSAGSTATPTPTRPSPPSRPTTPRPAPSAPSSRSTAATRRRPRPSSPTRPEEPPRPGPAPRPAGVGPRRRHGGRRRLPRRRRRRARTTATPSSASPSALQHVGDPEAARYLDLSAGHERLGTLVQRRDPRLATTNPALIRELGAACAAVGRLPEARAWYNIAIRRNPLDTEAQQALYQIKNEKPPAS